MSQVVSWGGNADEENNTRHRLFLRSPTIKESTDSVTMGRFESFQAKVTDGKKVKRGEIKTA